MTDSSSPSAGWTYLRHHVERDLLKPGVAYRKVSSGPDVLVVFAGTGVLDDGAQAWADALLGASSATRLRTVGHAYAVRGPKGSDSRAYADVAHTALLLDDDLHYEDIGPHLQKTATLANTLFAISHSSASKFLCDFLWNSVDGTRFEQKLMAWNLDGFWDWFMYHADVMVVGRAVPHSWASHIQLVTSVTRSTDKHLIGVNLDYADLRRSPQNVCTRYLNEHRPTARAPRQ